MWWWRSMKKRWGHTILPQTIGFCRECVVGEEWSDADSAPMGTVITVDPLCHLQTHCDPCVPSLFPEPCCSSSFFLFIGMYWSSIPSPPCLPQVLAQLVSDPFLWFVSLALSSSLISVFLPCWVYSNFSLPVFLTLSVALSHSSFSESSIPLGVHYFFCLLYALLPLQPQGLCRSTLLPCSQLLLELISFLPRLFIWQVSKYSWLHPFPQAFLFRCLLLYSSECGLPFYSDSCPEYSINFLVSINWVLFLPSFLSPPHLFPFSRSSPPFSLIASSRSSKSWGESVLPLLSTGAVTIRSNLFDFLCMQGMHKILSDFTCTALTCAYQNVTFELGQALIVFTMRKWGTVLTQKPFFLIGLHFPLNINTTTTLKN